MHATSFPHVVGPAPAVLILGSMPGRASLAAGEYYAHPRNAFWPILDALGIAEADRPYVERLAELESAGVALWDVLASCERRGSLDAAIARESETPNDVAGLLVEHPSIRAVLLNGTKAETTFRRHIAGTLDDRREGRLLVTRLPSTSPARAIPFDAKLAAWEAALSSALGAETLALRPRRSTREAASRRTAPRDG